MLIGITGRKRHGKSTVGDHLVAAHGFRAFAFADRVKAIGAQLLGITLDQAHGRGGYDREAVLDEWGISVRQALQGVGDGMRQHVHPEVWIRATIREAVHHHRQGGSAVITDVRYPNEAAAIREAGGLVWKVVRPGLADDDDDHPSEASVDLIKADWVLRNACTLDVLCRAADAGLSEEVAW